MTSIINASVSSNGIVSTADASGILLCQSNGKNTNMQAWVHFNPSSGSAVINASYNVSSVTRNSTGNYTINFTTSMPNANYSLAGMAQFGTSAGAQAIIAIASVATPLTTTNANVVGIRTDTATNVDFQTVCCSIFSS